MAIKDNQVRLGRVTISLHWFVAISMISMLILGFYMKNAEAWGLYHTHKSLGIILLSVILARVLWRIKKGWPEHVGNYSHFELRASKIAHWLLIIGTVLMPISGLILSAGSGHGFGIFTWPIFPPTHNDVGEVVPFNADLAALGYFLHTYAGYLISATVLLHVVGALKHHYVDKDNTLRRMLGRGLKQ